MLHQTATADSLFASNLCFRPRLAPPIRPSFSMDHSTQEKRLIKQTSKHTNLLLACGAARDSHETSPRKDDAPVHGKSDMIVGVLGGGQLGRMLCQAASQMAIKVMVLDPLENCPASALSYHHMVGSFDDSATVQEFAKRCGVLTVEIEHVDVATLEILEKRGVDCQPKASTIRIIQDKYLQKVHFSQHAIPLPEFMQIDDLEGAKRAGDLFGYPLMIKSKRLAYDGRGNAVAGSEGELSSAWVWIKQLECIDSKWFLEIRTRPKNCRSFSLVFSTPIEDKIGLNNSAKLVFSWKAFGNRHKSCRTLIVDRNIMLKACLFQGAPSYIIACKLKALKSDLKAWNEEDFGNIEKKKLFLVDLWIPKGLEEERGLVKEEIMLKAAVTNELGGIMLLEEVRRRQKSRALWLREGDNCTKFFHQVANSNRRNNSIEQLVVNVQKNTLYVGGLAEEVNEAILHAAFIPFGDIKDVKTPLDQATQKHRSFGFVTFLEKEDASTTMDNMDGSELYGRVLTVNYALPERIKGGEQGWAAHPIWADADTWFERQQQEEEMQRIQAENRAAMEAAEELHRKKVAQEREGEKEDETEIKDDPMARAEAEYSNSNLQVKIVSAHRTPEMMFTYASSAQERGIQIIIAGAGGAAHLPGMVAALTPLPVIGVPVRASALDGLDSLLSIVQMPRGVPVATVAINNATNAGLLAVRMLGIQDADLLARMSQYQEDTRNGVLTKAEKLEKDGWESYLNL
ncbi:uncharacterized protein LOC132162467 [Corylus avellana]|uniref:uncharacterized protein LOC132162467 n=1 Tax=Corylus avellana TaxID=13451 RepID=UPI00286B09A2|nr:uncharacterized protein LOC132162467 [Corylus avellana]